MVNWAKFVNDCAHEQQVEVVIGLAKEDKGYTGHVKRVAAAKKKKLKEQFNALKKEIKACKTFLKGVNHVQLNAAMKKVKSVPYLDADQKEDLLQLIERIFLSVKQNRIANKGAQFAAKVEAEIQALRDLENAELQEFKEAHGFA